MAGYSGRALAHKLGIKPGTTIAILGGPRGYRATLGPLPEKSRVTRALRPGLALVQYFTKSRGELATRFPALARSLAPDGALWVSWPKGSSGVRTDLTENVVREIGLAAGLVDVKVCAVDQTWSGLKFVRRLRDRPDGGYSGGR